MAKRQTIDESVTADAELRAAIGAPTTGRKRIVAVGKAAARSQAASLVWLAEIAGEAARK